MSDPRFSRIGSPADKLIEECAELIHAICKARRFGWENHHPDDPPSRTNKERVFSEMDDVLARIRELEKSLLRQRPKERAREPR